MHIWKSLSTYVCVYPKSHFKIIVNKTCLKLRETMKSFHQITALSCRRLFASPACVSQIWIHFIHDTDHRLKQAAEVTARDITDEITELWHLYKHLKRSVKL